MADGADPGGRNRGPSVRKMRREMLAARPGLQPEHDIHYRIVDWSQSEFAAGHEKVALRLGPILNLRHKSLEPALYIHLAIARDDFAPFRQQSRKVGTKLSNRKQLRKRKSRLRKPHVHVLGTTPPGVPFGRAPPCHNDCFSN